MAVFVGLRYSSLPVGLSFISGKSGTKFSAVRNFFFLGCNCGRVEDRIHQCVFENLSGRLYPRRVLAIVKNLPKVNGLA
jgi:hypothetical protein